MSKRIPKKKPLDRYPYMDNDLKNWENQWVPTEIYALYVEQTNAKLDDLQTQIDNIDISGYLPRTEFDEYVSTTAVTLTNINNSIQTISDRLDNITADFVTHYEFETYKTTTDETLDNLQAQIDAIDLSGYVTTSTFNTYTTTTATTLSNLQDRIDNIEANYVETSTFETFADTTEAAIDELKPIKMNIRLNNTVDSVAKPGYLFEKAFTIQGITSDYFVYATITAGDYTAPFMLETSADTLTFYGVIKPASSLYMDVILIKGYV